MSSWGVGGGGAGGGGTSTTKTPLKGMRSVPKVINNCPINDSLVSFVLVMINNEFCLHMFSNHSCGRLRSFLFLPCPTRVYIDFT